MTQPVVSWCDSTNSLISSTLNFNVVDAGTDSSVVKLYIWNNKGGSAAVSNMTSCTITTKDQSGNDTGYVVTQQWSKVSCISAGEAAVPANAIGGTQGANLGTGFTGAEHAIAGYNQATGIIAGAINDGTLTGVAGTDGKTLGAYAEVNVVVHPPLNTVAGQQSFAFRVNYQYT